MIHIQGGNRTTWKIDMGLYKVLTDSNVPEILKETIVVDEEEEE